MPPQDPLKIVTLRLTNQGQGLLRGSVGVSDGSDWLRISSEPNPDQAERNTQVAIKTVREQRIVLHIDTRGLTPPQRFSGKLTVITNGGAIEVPVRFDLEAQPFPRPPFRGARTPRAMAERMRANPKQAAPLLEAGEVAPPGWATWGGGARVATHRGVAQAEGATGAPSAR